jgi:hypothetical protein
MQWSDRQSRLTLGIGWRCIYISITVGYPKATKSIPSLSAIMEVGRYVTFLLILLCFLGDSSWSLWRYALMQYEFILCLIVIFISIGGIGGVIAGFTGKEVQLPMLILILVS